MWKRIRATAEAMCRSLFRASEVGVEFTPREELGFKDEFEGYVARKDGKLFLQLHLYVGYYTVFWIGKTTTSQLWDGFQRLAAELSIGGVPVRSVRAQYVTETGTELFALAENPSSDEERHNRERHDAFVREHERGIRFVRYDGEAQLPVILWADLGDSQNAEIGFSCRKTFPEAAIAVLGATAHTKLDSADLAFIRDYVRNRVSDRTGGAKRGGVQGG